MTRTGTGENLMKTERTALITGAGSGIGAEVAQRLAQQGYHLIISGSNRQKLESLAEKLPVSPIIVVVDLSHYRSRKTERKGERGSSC